MGIDPELFIGKIPDHLICNICHDVLERGTLSGCSEDHPFCFQCAKEWLRQRSTCPTCGERTKESYLRETKLLTREVGSLTAKCPEKDCGWKGEYSELGAHLDTSCSYFPRPCTNRECRVLVASRVLADHLALHCAFTLFHCSRGGVDCGGRNKGVFTRGAEHDAHDAKCDAYRCPTPTCTTTGTNKLLQIHKPGCQAMEKARQTAVDEATALREQVRRLDQSLARAEAKIARLEVASAAAQGADASAGDELDMPNKRPRATESLINRVGPPPITFSSSFASSKEAGKAKSEPR